MTQYHPAGEVSPKVFPEINRRPTQAEFPAAIQLASDLGLRLDAWR